jgi:glycosyltransferase involved in cell wall biosynthesis
MRAGRPRDTSTRRADEIVFLSVNAGWGGSEELWAGAALELTRRGVPVAASVGVCAFPHRRIQALIEAGIPVEARHSGLGVRLWRKVAARGKSVLQQEAMTYLASRRPALAVLSGDADLPVDLLEALVASRIAFATICQANTEQFWPDDALASRYRAVMPASRQCFFVAQSNRRLFERQTACELANAEIVWNPYNVARDAAPPWPLKPDGELRLASVARLHPPSKGQDILLDALSGAAWRDRQWRLTLYGEGPMRKGLEHMVGVLGLQERVRFAGFVTPVENIWAENHVLAMPSRYEGLPLAMVEAMLCGRPVVATDVADHAELIEEGGNGFLADAPTVSSFGEALERLWATRGRLEAQGKQAARTIRDRIPAEPARLFAERLLALAKR